jgi:hypothetical protein
VTIFIAIDIPTPHKLQILATNNKTEIVFLLVSYFPLSEFYVPTFRNTPCVPTSTRPMKLEQTERSETLEHKIQATGNNPKKKNTTFTARRKFEIKTKINSYLYGHKM